MQDYHDQKKNYSLLFTPLFITELVLWVTTSKRDHVQLLGQYFSNKGLWVLKMEMYGCRVIIIQIYALKRLSLLHLWLHLLGHLEQRVYLIRFSGSWQKYQLPITPPALPRLLCALSLNQRNAMSPISRKPAKRKKEPREAPFTLDTPRHDFTEKTMWRAVAWAVCPRALSILLPKFGGPGGVKILILSLITDRMRLGWVGADLE